MSSDEVLCHWMAINRDHFSPFREYAPSRSTFLQGLRDPKALLTQSGFFSLLVFRGITFHTDFLIREKKVVFHDLDHWNATKAEYSHEEEKFFCSMTAYGGSATSQRKTKNAKDFWAAAEMWMTLIKPHPVPIPFVRAKEILNKKEMDTKMFSIGPLQKMLLLGEKY